MVVDSTWSPEDSVLIVSAGGEEPKMSLSELSTAGFVAASLWVDMVVAGDGGVECAEVESVRVDVMGLTDQTLARLLYRRCCRSGDVVMW